MLVQNQRFAVLVFWDTGGTKKKHMNISEIVALAGVVLSMGTNIGLYIHLSSVMNTRFDSAERKADARHESIERRLELMQGDLHQMDLRLTKMEH